MTNKYTQKIVTFLVLQVKTRGRYRHTVSDVVEMILLQRSSKPEFVWYSCPYHRKLDKSPACVSNKSSSDKLWFIVSSLARMAY